MVHYDQFPVIQRALHLAMLLPVHQKDFFKKEWLLLPLINKTSEFTALKFSIILHI
jgi:hypothetical protein